MAVLKGSQTEENLKTAFASEAQANRRYLYFANKADLEGQADVAALFRPTAQGETGHAHGHLEWLEQCGDPTTGLPFGSTRANLTAEQRAGYARRQHEYYERNATWICAREALRAKLRRCNLNPDGTPREKENT